MKVWNTMDGGGGVDKLDYLIALYNIKSKTRKKLVFLDFPLSCAIINCANGKHLDLSNFRNHIAEALIKASATPVPSSVGRPRHDRKADDLPAAKQTYVKSQ